MAAIDGDPETGWGVGFGESRNPFLALRFKEPVTADAETVITVRVRQDSTFRKATIGRFRLAMSDADYSAPETGDSNQKRRIAGKDSDVSLLAVPTDHGVPPAVLKAIQTPEEDRTEDQQAQVTKFFLWSQPDVQDSVVRLAKLESDRTLLQAAIPSVITTVRTRPRVTRILPRGNFLDETGAVVSAGDSSGVRESGDA